MNWREIYMNIVFLVGNGFDIRMGIESAYKKVEAHYANLDKSDERLKTFQKSLKKNGEYWSNFERAMGQYTDSFQDDDQAAFELCLNDFTEELIQYLQAEEAKIDYDLCTEEIKSEMVRSITKYDVDIPAKYRIQLNTIISKNESIYFRFISFNYTHILDECLSRSFTKDTAVGKHTHGGAIYPHLVNNSVLHIHGDLSGPIITGVDNQDQIANKKWGAKENYDICLDCSIGNEKIVNIICDYIKEKSK